MVPTFMTPPGFLGIARNAPDAAYCVAGIPLDLGTTNRTGSREAPQAVRRASRMLVDGANPSGWRQPLDLDIADIGDFAIALGDIAGSFALIEEQAAKVGHLMAIGGDHGITLPLLRALARRWGPLGLVHFDAHVDTWPDSFGQAFGHGSPFYHAIREGLVAPEAMIQIGIRSPVEKSVYDWTVGQGVRILTAEDVHERGPAAVAAAIMEAVGGRPAYLSFDVDVLDPSHAPGTGTPEIGGLFTWQVMAILRRLGAVEFVGMDVVEVIPAFDVSEITALAAATVVWQYLSLRA